MTNDTKLAYACHTNDGGVVYYQPLTLRIVIAPRVQTCDVSGGMSGIDNKPDAVTTRLSVRPMKLIRLSPVM